MAGPGVLQYKGRYGKLNLVLTACGQALKTLQWAFEKGDGAMRMLSRLLGLVEKPQRRLFALFTLLCLLSPAVDLFGVSRFIPVIQEALQPGASGQMAGQMASFAFILLLVGIFNLLKSRCATVLVMDIAHSWSLKIYALFEEEELEAHNQKNIIQAINSVRTDTAVCAGMITSYVNLVVALLTVAAYSVVMIYLARWIGVITCLLVAAFAAAFYFFGSCYIVRYGEKNRTLEIKASGLVSTAFGAYKEIKIDSRKRRLLERYRKASGDCAQVQKDYSFLQGIQGTILRDFMQAALIFLLAAVLAVGIDLSRILPDTVIYIMLLIRVLPVSHQIVQALTSLQYASKYYEALDAALERYSAMRRAQAERTSLREKRVTLARGIRVENLSFQYPNGKRIFEDASLDIPAGSSVAIIGASGEGKTTFLDLLLGLLHPQSGHIWYDDFDIVEGRDSQGPCRVDLGNVISYIPQTVYLNDDTIRSNVAFMVEEDEERLIECLKCVQIWEDVREMPDGLDTIIGEYGVTISGGQRQRIALARALYKQFEILIMDEATAALDLDTENAVIDSIKKMRGDKTLLLVTHHPSLANECQYIYRIENHTLVKVR